MAWLSITLLSGCGSARYYWQAASGHMTLMSRREPIRSLVDSPTIDSQLRSNLVLVLELRDFAQHRLGLPAGRHYTKYADIHRPCAVWNVSAAPEFSLEASTWWYPFAGRLKYRGFFAKSDAAQFARKLREQGLDVSMGCVDAYSTLGFFPDPVLNTFIDREPAELAELLFHELAHQRVFVAGDTDFNEAMATAVGQIGARLWLGESGRRSLLSAYELALEKERRFVGMVQQTRKELETVYAATESLPLEARRSAKLSVLARLIKMHEDARADWGGSSPYDAWFAIPLNNAHLNSVATYYDLVPAFESLFNGSGRQWEQFFDRVRELQKLSKKERHARLVR
ncbi:MAG: aminopeptidase [Verrucomicrobia bacterium]|nr:aminopeptidase [Verrucomicrobiota bacterium]